MQVRDALSANAVRVIDLFREWDDDGTGTVDRKEFHRGMKELGLDVASREVDGLFDSMNPDGDTSLSLKELTKQLRPGGAVELDAKLQVGGAGEIVTESTSKIALRKGESAMAHGGTRLLQGFDIDESSDKTVAEQACCPALPKLPPLLSVYSRCTFGSLSDSLASWCRCVTRSLRMRCV